MEKHFDLLTRMITTTDKLINIFGNCVEYKIV